jgi:hypothetical protein
MDTLPPLWRVWGYTAAFVAVLLLLRGAWAAALAVFLLSPAPVMMFAPRGLDGRRLSLSWFGGLALALVVLAVVFALVVASGGLPPVHEWRPAR